MVFRRLHIGTRQRSEDTHDAKDLAEILVY